MISFSSELAFFSVFLGQPLDDPTPRKKARKGSDAGSSGSEKSENAPVDCHADKCITPRVPKGKWCTYHKRIHDAMVYQAQKETPPQTATLQAAVSTSEGAAKVFSEFESENPTEGRYKRKQLIDWVDFSKKHGVRNSSTDRSEEQPMEERKFEIWATQQKG